MLTFRFFDADGMMTVYEKLTTGMVGKQAKLEFSAEWANRRKTAVFTSGSVTKDVLNVTDIVTIPHEVLQNPGDKLYVGIYGVSEDGTQITPTIYAQGPKIFEGADPSGDESTDVTLPVWAQLESRVSHLEKNGTGGGGSSDSTQNASGLTTAQINALDSMFKVCAFTKADVSAEYTAFKTAFGITDSGGETVQNVYVRNGEYLYGSPTDVTWGDNSLSYRMGTSTNGVYTHVGEAYHLEAGKTYTLFADMADKAEFIRVLYKANDANAYLGTQLGQLSNTASYHTFTVPEDAKWVNLLFGLMAGTAAAVAGDLGTWNNIAIYEGELTERP